MPLNEKVIGKKYYLNPIVITAKQSIFYALAYNDDNDAYFDNRRKGGIIAPPMYASSYVFDIPKKIYPDKETGVNPNMMVHYTQELEWFKPVKPGDEITTEGSITHINIQKKGGILGWDTISKNQNDEIVVKTQWEIFDKSAGSDDAEDTKREQKSEPVEIIWTEEMEVREGQSFIYAEASNDYNPIHIDDEYAKSAQLPGVILHGLCTMAFAFKAAVNNFCGEEKDPLKIKKFKVQFARPVLPGQTLTFQGYKISDEKNGTRYGIIVKNNDGKDVLRDAWCIVA